LDVTFFTDEAWFHLLGYVNSQNSLFWSAAKPNGTKDMPIHDQKVGVCCAVSRNPIICPIFFDDTFNSKRYCEVILYPFIGHLNEEVMASGHFQQDGASAHTARVSMTLLRDLFGDRIISKDIRPPQSPDLTCRKQRKAQFTQTILALSLNWRKPLQISSGPSLRLNCRESLKIR
jgi:hypothetical protein